MAMVSTLLNVKSRSAWSRSPPFLLLEGRAGGNHDFCSSELEKWRSVVVVILNHFQSEGGKVAMVYPILFLGSGGALSDISMGMGMV